MHITDLSNWERRSIVDHAHPLSIFKLLKYDDDYLINMFHVLLEEIQNRLLIPDMSTHEMIETAQNIIVSLDVRIACETNADLFFSYLQQVIYSYHGGWASLDLGQDQLFFPQQLQQQHLVNLPEQNFFINQQPQQVIEYRQQGGLMPAEQQGSSNEDKHESFLDRFNKENERNEKMKNRYEDELVLKARAELEAEEKKAIEIEQENARKLKDAEERLKRTRIENGRKEDTVLRTDEAISRANELKRQVREMAEKAEQEKRDSERRIEERRREAAVRRDQDRQRPLIDTRSRLDEFNMTRFSHEDNATQRDSNERTSRRGYGERDLRNRQNPSMDNWRFDEHEKQKLEYRQQLLLENKGTQSPPPAPPKYMMLDSDDSDSDSDEEKRQNPYELIGLPNKEGTPVEEIATTQRVLNRIHQKTMDTAISEAERSRAEKRLTEIKWAADILLDEMNRRAFDEAGAMHPHEQQAWKKKSKWSTLNDQDRD
jgi:hypothetical protein